MLGFVSSQKSQGTYNYLFADGNRGSVGQVTKLGDTHIRARGIRGCYRTARGVIVLSSIGSLGRPCRNFHLARIRYETDLLREGIILSEASSHSFGNDRIVFLCK